MPAMTKPLAGRGETSTDLKQELGAYIRELRTKRGMTQADLAKAVGMAYYTAISAIEVGRNSLPPERYADFADALGVPPKAFMQRVLALTNPWAAAMLWAKDPRAEIERLNSTLAARFAPVS